MEITNVAAIAVANNENIPFTETVIPGSQCIIHREGSGLVTLRGITTQARARYKVEYSGNIAVPTDGVVGAISIAIAINGEPIQATRMIATPANAVEYFNVSAATYIDVPKGCCANIAIKNTSGQIINIANSNLIVTREA